MYKGSKANKKHAENPIIFQIFAGRSNLGVNTYKPAIIDAQITLGFPPVNAQNPIKPKIINSRFQP